MRMNFNRMLALPNSIKLFTLIITILVAIFVGAAIQQPAGTTFIWVTAIFSLIVNLVFILILLMDLDEIIFSQHGFVSWPLIECIWSILFGITYFISVWLCIGGSNYGSYVSFTIAGFLCFANFVAYSLNVLIFGRIWANEQHGGPFGAQLMNDQASYGAP